MTVDRIDPEDTDRELLYRVENNEWLETCDWGLCSRPTAGFAWGDSDPLPEWLAICRECAEGVFPVANVEPVRVDRLVWLGDIEVALGWRPVEQGDADGD